MSGWYLIAIFLFHLQPVHERYATKAACVDALTEMKVIAKGDFFSGVCQNEADEDDTVMIEEPLPVEASWP